MELWIIRDGEKAGPFQDFEIRSKIRNGELDASTPAWHPGIRDWQRLGDIEWFRWDLEETAPEAVVATPPAIPTDIPAPRLVRRFWARWLDLYLYGGIWWIALWAAGRDIEAVLDQPWIMLLHFIPWFILEAWWIHRWGITPGKWLLNLKVTNRDGSLLSMSASLRRSARVFLLGIGLGVQGVALVCQLIGWITSQRLGRPLWDHVGDHIVQSKPIGPARIASTIAALVACMWLQMIVLAPYVMKTAAQEFPELYQQMQRNPPWHLPKRN